MQWGFGWELGPFETIDAIGVREFLEALNLQPRARAVPLDGAQGRQASGSGEVASDIPPLVADVLAAGRNRFRDAAVPPAAPDLQILRSAKDRQRVVRKNAGASLVDLGDGVLALEFHSKMNAIGGDTVQMIHAGVKEAAANFAALVVGNDAPNFSAGANLMLLLLEAQEGNWDEVDLMIRAFQGATAALRYADVPVVVAPAGLTLGGGCEIALHADRVQAAAESYIGLVEVGVGLIPGGGGTKEMLARAVAGLPVTHADLLPFVQRVFETIGFAKVSTSAADAQRLGFLGFLDGADRVTMNRERVMADAKELALERVREGYQRPSPRTILVGGDRTAGRTQARHPPRLARRPHHRSRRPRRTRARQRPCRRRAPESDDRQRAVHPGSRARSVPETVRRAQDARAHSAHAENRQAAEKLMDIVDRGSGPPLVLIPGLQGRWEYARPTVDALSAFFRVITVLARRRPGRRTAAAPTPRRGRTYVSARERARSLCRAGRRRDVGPEDRARHRLRRVVRRPGRRCASRRSIPSAAAA